MTQYFFNSFLKKGKNMKKIQVIIALLSFTTGAFGAQFLNVQGVLQVYDNNNLPPQEPLPDGALDITFGVGQTNTGGLVTGLVAAGSTANEFVATAVDQNGKIIAVGDYIPAGLDAAWVVARFNTDGTLDQTFGTGGYVIDTFNPAINASSASSVVIDSENRIVVGGTNGTNNAAVARYLSDGSFDQTFGEGGVAEVDVSGTSSEINSLTIDSLGNIILAGENLTGGATRFLVVRFTSAGVLDTAFFNPAAGYVILSAFNTSSSSDIAYAVTTDSSNNIIVAGVSTLTGTSSMAVARLTYAGALDGVFGTAGRTRITTFTGGSAVYSMVLDDQGRILLGGESNSGTFSMARLLSTGVLDTTFATSGKGVYVLSPLTTAASGIESIALDAYQRIIGAGTLSNGGNDNFVVARFTQNGALDTTFGAGGFEESMIEIGGIFTYIQAFGMTLDQQARIVVVGSDSRSNNFVLARYTTAYTYPYYQAQFASQPLGFLG